MVCGNKGADVRPDWDWDEEPVRQTVISGVSRALTILEAHAADDDSSLNQAVSTKRRERFTKERTTTKNG